MNIKIKNKKEEEKARKEKEKIPLLVVYKQDDSIYAENVETIINGYELYGFLKIYLETLKYDLLNNVVKETDD